MLSSFMILSASCILILCHGCELKLAVHYAFAVQFKRTYVTITKFSIVALGNVASNYDLDLDLDLSFLGLRDLDLLLDFPPLTGE